MDCGSVEASKVVSGSVEDRFARFMQALRAGLVVPLLGAGVSVGSVRAADGLTDTLRAKIDQAFPGISGGGPLATGREKGEFARLAEILYWQTGNAIELCETLGIPDWVDGAPTRAHRYLALLTCEGLITEVVTTNWDCCLEAAWRQARGLDDDAWRAIACAEDLGDHHQVNGVPRLRLYKINGCAARLKARWEAAKKDEEKAAAAEEIMVTDRQLQQFGKRRWAGDLVKVLLRERQIILSGFGSNEPQIWHVIQDILEEFSLGDGSKTKSDPDSRSLWVCEYCSELKFHILQALVGENHRHDKEWNEFPSVFSGDDCRFFNRPGCAHLDAGDFWQKVWHNAVREGLKDSKGPVAQCFVGQVIGRRYRSGRAEDDQLFGLWKEVVETAFTPAAPVPDFLTEPNGWSSGSSASPDKNAPCAPKLLCVAEASGMAPVYLSMLEEPEYWIVLVIVLVSGIIKEDDEYEVRIIDRDPQLRITIGQSTVTTGASRAHRIGPIVRRCESSGEKTITIEQCVPLAIFDDLRQLGEKKRKLDQFLDWAACMIQNNCLLHLAREIDARTGRSSRRKPDGV